MELWLPDHIALNDTTNALIADVEEVARRVNEHRPLEPDVVARIDDDLLGERVYSSNAIEGNTLDYRETVMILRQGIGGFRKKREAKEARNLGAAIKSVTTWMDGGIEAYDVDRFREAHRTILTEIDDHWAGKLRTDSVMIQGAKYQPPDHSVVPAIVERVMEYLRNSSHSNIVLESSWTHWAIARIHPFYDGNGRIARLWQDIVLLKGQLTCAVVRPEDRRNYLDSLAAADEGDFDPLVQLVAQRVAATFDKYLEQLGRTAALAEWVTKVAGEADERAAEKTKLAFERWRRKMEQVLREFEFCAAKVSQASQTIGVQVQAYPMIDQTQWQNIRDGIRLSKTGLFNVDFSVGGKRLRYHFFFGKHFWKDFDDDQMRAEQRVNLLISEEVVGSGTGVRLDELDNCPLTIREILVEDDRLVCRRVDLASPRVDVASPAGRYDHDVPALRIAQDFIGEVVLHRLT